MASAASWGEPPSCRTEHVVVPQPVAANRRSKFRPAAISSPAKVTFGRPGNRSRRSPCQCLTPATSPRRIRPAYRPANPTRELSLRTGHQTRLPMDRLETGSEGGADEEVVVTAAAGRPGAGANGPDCWLRCCSTERATWVSPLRMPAGSVCQKCLSIQVGQELARSGRNRVAHTRAGLVAPRRCLTDKRLMYHEWHTTTHRSYVTQMSGEECP
jgi:hypothetical protein